MIVNGGEKKVDLNTKKNSAKRVFCRKYDGYEDFCRGLLQCKNYCEQCQLSANFCHQELRFTDCLVQ